MAMDLDTASELVSSLPAGAKQLLFARLEHMLTIVARDTYEAEGTGVKDPARLRQINELQHRLTDVSVNLMMQKPTIPDSVIVEFFLGDIEDKGLACLLRYSFERVLETLNYGA